MAAILEPDIVITPDTPPDPVPIRMEVDVWWTSNEQIHAYQQQLFIEALLYFQELPVTDQMSYFQIAGIHGQPWTPWGENTVAKTPYRGYCTHGSILFPTWHRHYLILFEKALMDIMIDIIVPRYPDIGGLQEQLKTAATQWRLPYWDWAQQWKDNPADKGKYRVPHIMRDKELYIATSTGWTKIRNPMHQFVMPNKEPMGKYGIHSYKTPASEHFDYDTPFEKCYGTSRWVDTPVNSTTYSADFIEGAQNHEKLEAALAGHDWYENKRFPEVKFKDTLAEAVYRFFSKEYFTDYGNFASTCHDPNPDNKKPEDFLSLEGVHNNAHNWIGGLGTNPDTGAAIDGHMTEVPISAFDPVFWLHHANIDRYFAIWQELNQDSWFDKTEETDTDGTWFIAKYGRDSPTVELRPFNMVNNAPYNSSLARDFYTLGYSYTECQPWLDKYKDNGEYIRKNYIDDLKKQLSDLYFTSASLYLKPGNSDLGASRDYFEDYIVNVVYDRFELDGLPFLIHILLKPTEDVSLINQHLNPDHVGIVYNFSTPTPRTGNVTCNNCNKQRDAKALSTGQVPITSALIYRVNNKEIKDLPSMKKEDVGPWLKDNLSWRVTLKGREIPLDEMKSLTVGVAVGQAQHFQEDNKLSEFKNYQYLTNATDGKNKGMKPDDGTLMCSV